MKKLEKITYNRNELDDESNEIKWYDNNIINCLTVEITWEFFTDNIIV